MPSKSKSQRKLMGYAYSIKKAGFKSDKFKDAPEYIQQIAKSMTKKQLMDFAKTKEDDLPKKKNENIMSFSEFVNERRLVKKSFTDMQPYGVAGIEYEDLNQIVFVELNGEILEIEENDLDKFMENNQNAQIIK